LTAISSWTYRIWAGGGFSASRLHDRKGNLIDLRGACYLPHCLLSTAWTKVKGHRPELPWLGYRTIRWLERTVRPNWRVLEFGSGMSSLWLIRRIPKGLLVSVESSPEWHALVKAKFESRGHRNVDYRLRGEDYPQAVDNLPDASFDLVIVDGIRRDECMPAAFAKAKPGGYILLDNTDDTCPEEARAERMLLEGAKRRGGWSRFTTDFYPGMILPCESLLARV
jgi:hypothetical protein